MQAIAELLQMDNETNGNTTNQYHITMRRYACMALTNLTFGDGTNKALLCSMVPALKALVQQLESSNEDLCQVAASVLRNLSWHADFTSKRILRDVGAVPRLMRAGLVAKKESTLKSLLSALWNFSSHCIENKADICATEGALQFLIQNLTYRSPLKTLSIIENCGGILRNISSHIAVREDYRAILRQHGCLQILLKHLRSPSLTVVSNACGTLWNLSARCPEDQKILMELGAMNMLKNLVHSKHKMISMGSAAALKNLLSAMPALGAGSLEPVMTLSGTKPDTPGLHMRRQRALENELEQQNLSETCDNMESPQGSPTESPKLEIHAKPKHSPAVASLLSSSGSRMTSSLRGQLPVDPVHGHCHPGNQGNASSIHASFEGITDKKRVQEILHRSNKLLADRQSPVVCDVVAPGIRDITRIAGGSLDIMTGSHSQFQDVKMMHSFSSYCEPTASTSPETSPVDKRMTDDGHTEMAPSWSAKRFHRPLCEPLRQTEEREGLLVPEAVFGEVKGQPSGGLFITSKSRLANTLTEEKESNKSAAEFGSESSSNGNTFSQNRLSIAGCENIFSFESEDTVPVAASPLTTDVLRKEPAGVTIGEDNHNFATNSRNDDAISDDFSAARSFDCASVFSFESSQSRMSDLRAEDSGECKSVAQDIVSPPIWEAETNIAPSMGSLELEQETSEEAELPRRDSVLKYDQVHQRQMVPKCRYVEKFLKRVSSSGDNADEFHTSPDALLSPDTYEGKNSSPGFRRLSSSSNDGSRRDDVEPTYDTDVVGRQELPRLCSDADSVVVEDLLDQEEATFDLRRFSDNTEAPLEIWQKPEDECFPIPDICPKVGDALDQQNTDIQTEADEKFPTPPPPPELVSPVSQATPPQITSPPATPQKKALSSFQCRKIPHIKTTPPMTLPQMTFHETPSSQMTSPPKILHRMMSCKQTPSHATTLQMTSPHITSPPATPQKHSGMTPTEITSPSRNLPQITTCTDRATVPQLNSSPMTSPTKALHKKTSPCMTPPQMTSPKRTPLQPSDCLSEKLESTGSNQITETFHESKVQENFLLDDDRNANLCSSTGILQETTNCSSNSTREPRLSESLLPDSPLCDSIQLGKDLDDEFILVNVGYDDKTEVEMLETSLMMPGAEPRNPVFLTDARCGMIGSLQSTGDSVVDIMNESFPDLSSSLISDMATSHEDMLAADCNARQEKFSSNPASCEKANFDLCKVSSASATSGEAMNTENVDEKEEIDDFELVDAISDVEYDEISMEQERALEENASLILSELERTTMLESGMSELRLLECETLSLVSNDDEDENNMSDGDVSEASCSVSLTSVAQSEPASERSSNTFRTATISVARPAGPRIVKPTATEPVKQQQGKDPENGPKAIRGRRKGLYSAVKSKPAAADPSTVKANTVKPVAAKTQPLRKQVVTATQNKQLITAAQNKHVVTATQSKPVSNNGSAKPVKPIITRSGGPKMSNQPSVGESTRRSVSHVNRSMTPSSSGAQNKTRAPSLPNERKPISYNRQTRSAPAQTKTAVMTERADNTRQLGKKTFGGASDKIKQTISAADKERIADESSLADVGGNTVDQEDGQDRPKPPIKQDTFVKDAPSSFSIMVIDNGEEEEKPNGRQKEKESDTVSRSSIDSLGKTPVGSGGSQSIRRPAAGTSSSTPKPGLRQAKSDAMALRRNPVPEAQTNRPRASSAISSVASSTTKAPRSSAAESSTKASSFPKRPPNTSNTTKLGSNTSIASVGKTSRNSSAHTYDSRSSLGERVSSVSPAPKFSRPEKTLATYRKASATVDHPAVANSERSVRATEENAASRNNSRQLVRLFNKRQGVAAGSGTGAPTLTRSSTYDKLTDDDHMGKDQQSEVLEDYDEKRRDKQQPEGVVTEIDPRRLTRVVESKFGHVLPNSDEDCMKSELSHAPKSQEREELTLELESRVSIMESLYRDQGLERSTVSDHVFERRDEPRPLGSSPENQTRSFTRPAMNSRSSSTLPASFFSQSRVSYGKALQDSDGQISPQTSPIDDAVLGVDGKSGRKTLRYKEGRKLGFGLWKRNNASKDKPEEDDKTLQLTHDAKLGSPVRKVFGWFRRGNDSSKKNSTSKIPAPESNRSNETPTLDNCRTRTADVNSNQTRNGEYLRRGTNFLPERQVGLSSVRANSPLRAAIVQPFNYKPVHSSATVRGVGVASEIRNESSLEPMTKTEMLLARRRKSRAVSGCRDSVISDDNLKVGAADQAKKLPSSPNGKDSKSGFLVTSV